MLVHSVIAGRHSHTYSLFNACKTNWKLQRRIFANFYNGKNETRWHDCCQLRTCAVGEGHGEACTILRGDRTKDLQVSGYLNSYRVVPSLVKAAGK